MEATEGEKALVRQMTLRNRVLDTGMPERMDQWHFQR